MPGVQAPQAEGPGLGLRLGMLFEPNVGNNLGRRNLPWNTVYGCLGLKWAGRRGLTWFQDVEGRQTAAN